ncbi:hypothetical protein NP493_1692g00006 [Ridgeia piscesae]|uniref:Uncharacterized protein n=1 Tax=Ridgeia piscesae TaxID=27915 RepID=A0AAD9N9A3_RIDPI|nr:hypothetical protein NP493_1692g00006 [Ridgeia piscesae]
MQNIANPGILVCQSNMTDLLINVKEKRRQRQVSKDVQKAVSLVAMTVLLQETRPLKLARMQNRAGESMAEKKGHRKSVEPGTSEEHHRSMEKREGGDKTLADIDRRAEDSMSIEDDGPAAGATSVKAGNDAEVGRSAQVEKSPKGGDSTKVGNSKKDSKPTGGDKCPKEEKSKKDTKSTEKGKSKKDGKSGEVKSSGDSKLAEDGKTMKGGNSKKGSLSTGDDKLANSGKVKKTTKPGLAEEGKTGKDVDEDKSAAARQNWSR